MSIKLMSWVWENTNTSGSERLLLLALADSANDHGICWPSLQTLATKTGVSRRYIIDLLDQLKEKGLVEIEHRHDDKGDFTSNIYRLVVNYSSLPSEPGDTTGSEPEFTGVVNQTSLKPSFNPNMETPIKQIKKGFIENFVSMARVPIESVDVCNELEAMEKKYPTTFWEALEWAASTTPPPSSAMRYLRMLGTALPNWKSKPKEAQPAGNYTGEIILPNGERQQV